MRRLPLSILLFVFALALSACSHKKPVPSESIVGESKIVEAKAADGEDHLVVMVSKKGETLFGLSKQYTGSGFNWEKVVKANPGLNPKRLKVGQKIVIPQNLALRDTAIPGKGIHGKAPTEKLAEESKRMEKMAAVKPASKPQVIAKATKVRSQPAKVALVRNSKVSSAKTVLVPAAVEEEAETESDSELTESKPIHVEPRAAFHAKPSPITEEQLIAPMPISKRALLEKPQQIVKAKPEAPKMFAQNVKPELVKSETAKPVALTPSPEAPKPLAPIAKPVTKAKVKQAPAKSAKYRVIASSGYGSLNREVSKLDADIAKADALAAQAKLPQPAITAPKQTASRTPDGKLFKCSKNKCSTN